MTYSISDLEQLTGVSSHTIRIWERRYNALEPMRSAGNTRLYGDDQLRKLLNIVSLSQSGLKISQVCALSEGDMNSLLQQEIEQTASNDADYEYYISRLLSYGLNYDGQQFEELLSHCIIRHNLKTSYLNVIYPMLVRLGLMWRKDNICPAREHFLSSLIRQRLYRSISEIDTVSKPESTWLLFLPEDEDHEIGLLFANYLLKASGQKVIYLGAKVPLESAYDVIRCNHIDHVLVFMVRSRPSAQAESYLGELGRIFEKQKVHVAGNLKAIDENALLSNVDCYTGISDLENEIKRISHGS
ncbi:MerR family transcriptional regulator [Pedobacter sp. PWIIR3]